MGRRGINAKPKKRAPGDVSFPGSHPWESPGLSRADRVIAFIETLPVTAGPLAGTLLKLRPWQKRFVRSIYRTDKAGNRLVRTAVLSVARKNGKTMLASCLALAHLVRPRKPRAGAKSTRWRAPAFRPAASSTKWSRSSPRRRG